jgi:hypothetical protein
MRATKLVRTPDDGREGREHRELLNAECRRPENLLQERDVHDRGEEDDLGRDAQSKMRFDKTPIERSEA